MSIRTLPSIRVLTQPHLATLWSAQVFSAFGDRLHEIAIVWLSVQLIGEEAGFVLAAGAMARLLCGLVAGVYVDRWDRRKTMIGADLLRAVAVGTIPIASLWGEISLPHLAVVAAVVGGLGALFQPALLASLPGLARDPQLLQATNGLMDVTERLARVIAPGMAGWMIAWIPLPQFFTIDALTYVVSALAVGSLASAFVQPPRVVDTRGVRGVFSDIIGALGLIRRHRPLTWGLVAIFVVNIAWSAAFTIGVALLAVGESTGELGGGLGGGVNTYGLIVAAYGVGNVLSNLVVGSITVRNRARLMFVGKGIVGVGFLLLAWAPSLPLAMLASAFAAVGGPMGDVMLLLFMQQDFPNDQIGKIFSARMTIASTGASLGLLLAGPLFGLVSTSLGIVVCASLMVMVGVAGGVRFWSGEA